MEKFLLEASRYRVSPPVFFFQPKVDSFCSFLFKTIDSLPNAAWNFDKQTTENLARLCKAHGYNYGFQCVSFPEPEQTIYFATENGGIMAYSTLTSQVTTIVTSNETCWGIAYDSVHHKIYWSTRKERKIYRTNLNGSLVETILSTDQCKCFSIFIGILVFLLILTLSLVLVVRRWRLFGSCIGLDKRKSVYWDWRR